MSNVRGVQYPNDRNKLIREEQLRAARHYEVEARERIVVQRPENYGWDYDDIEEWLEDGEAARFKCLSKLTNYFCVASEWLTMLCLLC